jgi:hypothetical protein
MIPTLTTTLTLMTIPARMTIPTRTATNQLLLTGANPAMMGLAPCVWTKGQGY